uniref:hypothetical protein n=1 Tax=Parerythrobacter lutipelagi TaxID=1964208 RepID=UPI0010F59A0E|nr:hypothetical protein [Parerythrobacter lutipelagi]
MNETLGSRIAARLDAPVRPEVAQFAENLAAAAGADAALFYGSNLRTGELEGVLDFYLLQPGPQRERIWPRVSYHEWETGGTVLRAKVAAMSLEQFRRAAAGDSRDTTIWARFVQPSALVWARSADFRSQVIDALAEAARTAARLAAALGPESGLAADYWRALFRATYQAEFRVEKSGREDSILSVNQAHFDGLLPLAWGADGVAFSQESGVLTPQIEAARRRQIKRWWGSRRRWGKPLNLIRLAKASTTFDGAARYAAWKIERHTGIAMEVTPWREKHPLLAAPGVLFKLWRAQRKQ